MPVETWNLEVRSISMQQLQERLDVFAGKMPQGNVNVRAMGAMGSRIDCHSPEWSSALTHFNHRCSFKRDPLNIRKGDR